MKGYTYNGREYEEIIGKVGKEDFAKWQAGVLDDLRSNRPIVISLRGFDGENPLDQFMKAYTAGGVAGWRATEWEMNKVGLHVQLGNLNWNKITFYDNNGKVIPKEKFPEPEWPH